MNELSADELRGMLRLRRAQLERSAARAREVAIQFDPDNLSNWIQGFQIPVTR